MGRFMSLELGMFPTMPMMFALFIPIAYNIFKGRGRMIRPKPILLVFLCSLGTVVFYPLTSYLYTFLPVKFLGYSIGKLVLFVLMPAATVMYAERWDLRKALRNLGVRRENIGKSVAYGAFAALITITVTLVVMESYSFDPLNQTILFFEAFTEEFFFRGFLFLYLLKKTNRDIAFATSTSAFVLAHPQHFTELFLISTVVQGVLLTVVAEKTENIIGPWIGHGLNRFVPSLIKHLFRF